MTRRLKAAPVVLLPLLLAGCGGWDHTTKPRGEFAMDDAECRQEAITKVQASHQKQDAPKWMTRAVGTNSYFVDGNDGVREQWHKSCLRLRGWTPDAGATLVSAAYSELMKAGLPFPVR